MNSLWFLTGGVRDKPWQWETPIFLPLLPVYSSLLMICDSVSFNLWSLQMPASASLCWCRNSICRMHSICYYKTTAWKEMTCNYYRLQCIQKCWNVRKRLSSSGWWLHRRIFYVCEKWTLCLPVTCGWEKFLPTVFRETEVLWQRGGDVFDKTWDPVLSYLKGQDSNFCYMMLHFACVYESLQIHILNFFLLF